MRHGQTCHLRLAGKLVLSSNRPRIKGHSVIPATCTTRSVLSVLSVWLSRTLLHLIMSELADASGKSGHDTSGNRTHGTWRLQLRTLARDGPEGGAMSSEKHLGLG
jgi:hypothetical protein